MMLHIGYAKGLLTDRRQCEITDSLPIASRGFFVIKTCVADNHATQTARESLH